MAGHSKWANIKHTKEAADKKRGKLFSKLSRDITVAARLAGTADVEVSPMLRVAVDKAKIANMPKDKIETAIKKGLGITEDGEITYENTYEAYAPGGIPMLIDTETDNPNRTLTEVKNVVQKRGGKMVPEGSVSWMFEEVGRIILATVDESKGAEEIILELMEIEGIRNIKQEGKQIVVITQREELNKVQQAIDELHSQQVRLETVELIKRIKEEHKIDSDANSDKPMSELIEVIEDDPDVVSVWVGVV